MPLHRRWPSWAEAQSGGASGRDIGAWNIRCGPILYSFRVSDWWNSFEFPDVSALLQNVLFPAILPDYSHLLFVVDYIRAAYDRRENVGRAGRRGVYNENSLLGVFYIRPELFSAIHGNPGVLANTAMVAGGGRTVLSAGSACGAHAFSQAIGKRIDRRGRFFIRAPIFSGGFLRSAARLLGNQRRHGLDAVPRGRSGARHAGCDLVDESAIETSSGGECQVIVRGAFQLRGGTSGCFLLDHESRFFHDSDTRTHDCGIVLRVPDDNCVDGKTRIAGQDIPVASTARAWTNFVLHVHHSPGGELGAAPFPAAFRPAF